MKSMLLFNDPAIKAQASDLGMRGAIGGGIVFVFIGATFLAVALNAPSALFFTLFGAVSISALATIAIVFHGTVLIIKKALEKKS